MKHHLFIAFALTSVAIFATGCTTVETPPERTPPPSPNTVIIRDQQPVTPVVTPVVAPVSTSTSSTVTRRSTIY